jgi:biotin operon repressor
MNIPMIQRLNQFSNLLTQTDKYLTSDDISQACGCSKGTVYNTIRKMREKGIGVHATKDGYVLSEFAQKKDDVGLLRKVNGRRTSDMIMLSAARTHMEKRWKTDSDRTLLGSMIDPLNINIDKLRISKKLIDSNLNIL